MHTRPRTHARAYILGCELKIIFLDAFEYYSNLICMASDEQLFIVYTRNDVRVSINLTLFAPEAIDNLYL